METLFFKKNALCDIMQTENGSLFLSLSKDCWQLRLYVLPTVIILHQFGQVQAKEICVYSKWPKVKTPSHLSIRCEVKYRE